MIRSSGATKYNYEFLQSEATKRSTREEADSNESMSAIVESCRLYLFISASCFLLSSSYRI